MPRAERDDEFLESVAPIVAGTLCPFAVKARMRGAPAYDEGRSLRANLEASIHAFTRFTARSMNRS